MKVSTYAVPRGGGNTNNSLPIVNFFSVPYSLSSSSIPSFVYGFGKLWISRRLLGLSSQGHKASFKMHYIEKRSNKSEVLYKKAAATQTNTEIK